MNKELRDIFKSAHREFMNRGKFMKIIPIPTVSYFTSDLSNAYLVVKSFLMYNIVVCGNNLL